MGSVIKDIGHAVADYTPFGGFGLADPGGRGPLSGVSQQVFGGMKSPLQSAAGTPPQNTYPASSLFPVAGGMGAALPGQISGMQSTMNPYIMNMLQSSMPGSQQYQNLWDMTSRNYMNQLTPKYSGAGLLTSGPGIEAMNQGMGDLSTQFANMMMGNQRAGIGAATSALGMPITLGTNAMGTMLGQHQGTNLGSPGWVSQISDMLGNAGSIGSFLSPLFGGLGSLFGGGGGAGLGALGAGGGMFDMLGGGGGFGSLFASVPELAPLAAL